MRRKQDRAGKSNKRKYDSKHENMPHLHTCKYIVVAGALNVTFRGVKAGNTTLVSCQHCRFNIIHGNTIGKCTIKQIINLCVT